MLQDVTKLRENKIALLDVGSLSILCYLQNTYVGHQTLRAQKQERFSELGLV